MTARKVDGYLETPLSSDDEAPGYNSEQDAAADSRTAGFASHRSKRQKLSATPSDSEEDGLLKKGTEEREPTNDAAQGENISSKNLTGDSQINMPLSPQEDKPEPPAGATSSSSTTKSNKKTPKPSKRGVIYLSRIPPYMPPHLVRTHLSTHGPITNLFLTPEPPALRTRRLKSGGNKKRSYVDGWIEFSSRKHARACVDFINGSTVGGKKGGWYRDDVWNAKYLKGFSWGDLMEGVRREEREREERVRVGVAKDKREREAFLRDVQGGKVEKTRRERMEMKQQKKKKSREEEGEKGTMVDGGGVEDSAEGKGDMAGLPLRAERWEQRRFRQSEVKGSGKNCEKQPDEVTRVLSKIF